MFKNYFVLIMISLAAFTTKAQEYNPVYRNIESEISKGVVDEKMLISFLNASRETQLKNEQGQNCHTVCFPCCYAPRECWTECEDPKDKPFDTNNPDSQY